MKDKEWLKEEIGELPCVDTVFNSEGSSYIDSAMPVMAVYDLIDQLDEPETLSQGWIKDHELLSTEKDADGNVHADRYIHVKDLQNLLVPKQKELVSKADELKPVIPQFVADYIELNKGWSEDRQEYVEGENTGLWFALNGDNCGMPNSVSDWLFNEEKVETFARAWLDGYTIEKEQRYVIKLDDECYLQRYEIDNKNIVTPFRIVGHLKEVAIKFDNKERAEKVAELVEGNVEELEE